MTLFASHQLGTGMEPSHTENRATALQAAVSRVLEEGMRMLEGALSAGTETGSPEPTSVVVIAPRALRPVEPDAQGRTNLLNNALILVFDPSEVTPQPLSAAGARREPFSTERRPGRGELAGPLAEMRVAASASEAAGNQVAINGLMLDFARHRAAYGGNPLHLTKREFTLLSVLARQRGRVVSQAEIVREFGKDVPPTGRGASDLVKAVVLRTRRKLMAAHADPHLIMTVRGVGYMIDSPVVADNPEPRSAQDPGAQAGRGAVRPTRLAR